MYMGRDSNWNPSVREPSFVDQVLVARKKTGKVVIGNKVPKLVSVSLSQGNDQNSIYLSKLR